MKTTIIKGYVGREEITAYIYPGSDFGLSWYKYQGKSYFGTVQFTEIIKIDEK